MLYRNIRQVENILQMYEKGKDMGKIYKSIEELIGHTPLMEVSNLEKDMGLKARLLVKLEYLNPAGSAKDRVALKMLDEAYESGKIKEGSVIIEPTSGNTGIGLAAVGASKGYKVIIVMPDTMSVERIKTMKAYGAQVVLSDGKEGMAGCIKKAEELAKEYPNSFIPGQFDNPMNCEAHRISTGPEIFEDTNGEVDVFVAGVGTGGTITGTGEYLKKMKPEIEVVAVEPEASPLLSGGKAGPHPLQGIGANFIPSILNTKIYDKIIKVTGEDAYETGRLLGKREGILTGITSGAALWAGIQLAKSDEYAGKTIVVLLPDTGDRYLSTPMFEEE